MKKIKKLFQIFRSNNTPIKTILGKIVMRLPFDIGRILSFKIKTQDYFLRFYQSALLIEFWKNPNDRISDYTFIKSYLKASDTYIDIGAKPLYLPRK